MSKYDGLKFLKETKARKSRPCNKCGRSIESGETYYKESIGKVNAPGLILRGFCVECHQEYSNKLLTEKI
jgi:hypothetical protein